ncbi:hypothetical protein BZA77DRAFT_354510 [Pyronema omphalodes]|nr:hypothetical protein BZA77DRAFT_354510 [Pyronema omphalodes]
MSTLQEMSLAVPGKLSQQSEELAYYDRNIDNMCGNQRDFDRTEELDKLLSWISPINPYERHHDILSRRHKGTGQWFIEMSECWDWMSEGKDDLKDVIEELQTLKKENRFLDLKLVCRFLTDALRRFDNVYVCIDTLDECQDNRVLFLRSLNDLLQTQKSGR